MAFHTISLISAPLLINFSEFTELYKHNRASQVVLVVKNLPANAGDIRDVQSLGREDYPEGGMATLSSIFAWRIP